jgi:hypothetical protein
MRRIVPMVEQWSPNPHVNGSNLFFLLHLILVEVAISKELFWGDDTYILKFI